MKNDIQKIDFDNKTANNLEFEVLPLKDLYTKNLNHLLTNPQQIGFYLIMLITEGNSFHKVDFVKYQFQKGSVFTIGKNQIQQFSSDTSNNGIILLFTENFIIKYFEKKEVFQRLLLFNDALLKPTFQLSENEFDEICQLFSFLHKEYFCPTHDQFKENILRSALHLLLLKLERFKEKNAVKSTNKVYFEDFSVFKLLVEKHIFETKSVDNYAKKLGYSTKKLNYITQSVINKSAKEFINELLILEIKRLLANTALSSKEIAYQCGFDEPTNFVKYFKKYTNQLPSDFRQSIQ